MLQKSIVSVVYALALYGVRGGAEASSYESPGYYPAPYGGWVDEWKESYGKAKKLVDSMTLAEKTNITAGSGYFMGRSPSDNGLRRSCRQSVTRRPINAPGHS